MLATLVMARTEILTVRRPVTKVPMHVPAMISTARFVVMVLSVTATKPVLAVSAVEARGIRVQVLMATGTVQKVVTKDRTIASERIRMDQVVMMVSSVTGLTLVRAVRARDILVTHVRAILSVKTSVTKRRIIA